MVKQDSADRCMLSLVESLVSNKTTVRLDIYIFKSIELIEECLAWKHKRMKMDRMSVSACVSCFSIPASPSRDPFNRAKAHTHTNINTIQFFNLLQHKN